MSYFVLKVVHLGALILWLGPALGSWLVLRYSQKIEGETSKTTQLIYRVFFFTVSLEHVAFIVLLTSGVLMVIEYQWWQSLWLQQKLMIVGLVVIPLEIVDIWLGNWKVNKLVSKRSTGIKLTHREEALIHHYHTSFTYLALILIPISTLLIMWIAVSKQALFH